MSTAAAPRDGNRRTWYLLHALAIHSTLVLLSPLAGLLITLVITIVSGRDAARAWLDSSEFPPFVQAFIVLGVLSMLLLWIAMLTDYFTSDRPKRASWGLALVFLHAIGAIIYFAFVWRPANSRGGT